MLDFGGCSKWLKNVGDGKFLTYGCGNPFHEHGHEQLLGGEKNHGGDGGYDGTESWNSPPIVDA